MKSPDLSENIFQKILLFTSVFFTYKKYYIEFLILHVLQYGS